MTHLAELLKPLRTPSQELYLLGVDAVREAGHRHAAQTLRAWLLPRPDLFEALAQHYLDTVIVPDISGAVLKSAQDGQRNSAFGQSAIAVPRGPLESGGANSVVPSGHSIFAPPLSPVEDREGQEFHAPSITSLPSPSSPFPDERGHRAGASGHSDNAPFVRKPPNPPRGREAIKLVNRAEDLALFDTFKVRGGKAIGDLTLFEARRIAATNEREARILRTLCNHVAFAPGGTTLRDAVPADLLRKAVEQNIEAADA